MAAPELRLNVSLDLGFFRQQLRQLSAITSSEFNAPLKVKFDKASLNKELSLLSNQLGRRKYNIQINDTSIKTARLSAQKLKNTLDLLAKTKYTIDVGVRQSGSSASGQVDVLESIFGRGKTGQAFGAGAVGQARSNVSREALLQRLSARSLERGGYNKPGLQRVITELGGTPSGNRTALVAQAKKLAESVDDALIDRVWSSVKDLQMNMRYSGGAGYGVGQSISKLVNSMSLVSSDPRAARQQLRALPPNYITTEMAGKASEQAMANMALGQTGAPVGAKFQNSFDKYLNSVVSQAMADAAQARQRYGLRQMGVNLSQKLLPPAGGTSGMAITPHRTFVGPSTGQPIPVAGRGALALYTGGGGGGGMPPGGGTGGGPGNFARRGGGSGGGFNMPNLPGAGLVREIGQEFAFATKQVLLFGTAYRALAFATNFPAQVGQAVAALQSFNNTLKAISPSAKEVEASNNLILQLVDKYNIPLQSARDGFTKLYASMQSAGFGGEEVRDIFTGISKAAATFGMSADKVDRVNYAFAQMASKGQVMSEELKGQLGDVLPGALGIFAEAAGFKGPDAIQKFSAALEDGAYKGQAMKQLLTNVGIVMNQEFGPGAEGAARTFQGAINRMQNSLTFLYEAFEPAAVQFLNAFVVPLTGGIKQLTDGFNAFFTGQAAQTAGGGAIAQQLNALKPSFEGILANIQALIPSFQIFGGLLLNVAKFLTALAGNPITGFLLKVYTNVLLVNTAFTLLGGRVLLGTIASVNAAIARMVAMTVTMNALGVATTRAGASIAGTQLQMALLQSSAAGAVGPVTTLLGSLLRLAAIGAIAIMVTIAISGANELRDAELRLARLRGEKDPVGPEGPKPVLTPSRRFVGATRETVQAAREKQAPLLLQYRQELKVLQQQALTAKAIADASEDNAQASVANTKARAAQARVEAKLIDIQNAQGILNLDPSKYPTAAEKQSASIKAMTNITGGGAGANGGTKLDTYDRSKLDFIRQQAEQEQLALDRRRQQNIISETRYKIDSAALALDTAKLEEAEKLRLATMATNKDNLSAQDKQLKLADLQIAYTNNLAIAQDKYNVAVEGAKKELEGPFNDAISTANSSIIEQEILIENIKNGIEELAPDQQAYLLVLGLTKDKTEDELGLLQNKIALIRQAIEKQIALNKEVERERTLLGLRNQLALARILDPGLELREQIRQKDPLLTDAQVEEQALLQEQVNAAQKAKDELKGVASSIGNAFGEAFKGIITGSMTAQEALANMFQSIADHFADMVAQMIAEWIKMMVLKGIEAIINPLSSLTGGGFGGGLSSGFSAGTSSAIDTSAAGWGAALNTNLQFANGGIAPGGFTAFANGGMVTGPTMGLVGEGRYNEAIVPLPDGKSIPVELAGGSSGATTVIVNVDAKGSEVEGNEPDAKQLGRVISAVVQSELIKQKRPGGLLASR